MTKKKEEGIGFYVRLPLGLRDKFKAYAREQSRSMNGQVVEMIRKAVGEKK